MQLNDDDRDDLRLLLRKMRSRGDPENRQAGDVLQQFVDGLLRQDPRKLELHEIGNTYVGEKDRFVVSLVVGYSEDDGVDTPEEALKSALDLTRDGGSWDTNWYVFDRKTGQMHMLEQKHGEPDYEP